MRHPTFSKSVWSFVLILYATTAARGAPSLDAAVDGGAVADLLARVRVELARPGQPGANSSVASVERMEGVESRLREVVALAPDHFAAHLLLAEVVLRDGRVADAITLFERACALARGPGEVFPCRLRLADAWAIDGQYEAALAEYGRQLEIEDARIVPDVLVRRAELLMALGKLADAEASFAKAVARLIQTTASRRQESILARALFGQAVSLDRAGRDGEARRIMWRALALDPSLTSLAPEGEAALGTDHPILPTGEVYFYRGLALWVLGDARAALDAFKQFVATTVASRWRKRAEDHLLELVFSGADAPAPEPRLGAVVAAATTDARGPLPAPLIDAAWKSRPRLLEPCMVELPPRAPRILRVPLLLEIDGKGVSRRAQVQLGESADFGLPSDWRAFAACVERRVVAGLRTVRPGNMRRTSARVELVLAIGGRS
jgi:tetratricopeptide (TPR) repeat protein